MDNDRIRELFQKLISDRCTEEELDLLFRLVELPKYEQDFKVLLEEHWETGDFALSKKDPVKRRRMLEELKRRVGEEEPEKVFPLRGAAAHEDEQTPPLAKNVLRRSAWLGYAASILLISGLLYYLFIRSDPETTNPGTAAVLPVGSEISPGGDRAVLTLSDGRQIVLDSATNGVLAEQGSSEVVKLANGQIVYRPGKSSADGPVYNTMSTPKGGQYRLVLPDGSNIWLNAASSVTYPVAFNNTERNIAVQGEVYLEVAADKQRPFRVAAAGTEIVVLGTKFNLNAYGNEEWMKTTLLEGSVRVMRDGREETLQPGQQCLVDETGKLKLVAHANTEETIAWKNGFFSFRQADIQTVMRQFERWYDIEVRYEGTLPLRKFEGELERGLQLSEILKILDKMGVGFRMEDRTLIVYAKPNP